MVCENRRPVEHLPRFTNTARRAAIATTLIAFAAGSAAEHRSEEYRNTGPADFAIPPPGSYALPPLGAAADGDVLTSSGDPIRLHDLIGSDATLLSVIYTRCTDGEGCPFATAALHAVGTRLASEPEVSSRLRLLSLSFDPARDTPAAMQRYGCSSLRSLTVGIQEPSRPPASSGRIADRLGKPRA